MAGIRVQHPEQRNVRYTVVEPNIPYPVPYVCTPPEFGGCGSTHLFKTHHLNLDSTGAVIVSTGVFARIKDRLALDGFVVANEVKKPPKIGIGMSADKRGMTPGIQIVRSPHSKEPL
ncbi:MAG TPA: hypothetical protein VFX15_02805 [Actinomycetes bacterium]|nr:hypothetical protein [Actinomycetes bacterium]